MMRVTETEAVSTSVMEKRTVLSRWRETLPVTRGRRQSFSLSELTTPLLWTASLRQCELQSTPLDIGGCNLTCSPFEISFKLHAGLRSASFTRELEAFAADEGGARSLGSGQRQRPSQAPGRPSPSMSMPVVALNV